MWGKERDPKPMLMTSLHTFSIHGHCTATVYKHLIEAAGGLGTDDIKPEGGRESNLFICTMFFSHAGSGLSLSGFYCLFIPHPRHY